ncbi:MAG: hypothetical protein M5U08_04405 [Burkholderiales bacterium]|nr:hypothetical protein [Burkholderiales bacterium]
MSRTASFENRSECGSASRMLFIIIWMTSASNCSAIRRRASGVSARASRRRSASPFTSSE